MAYSLSLQAFRGVQLPFSYAPFVSAKGALAKAPLAMAALPKKLCVQLARFIAFSALRAGAAFAAYKTIQWALIKSGKGKALEAHFTPRLTPLTKRIKKGLAPLREKTVAYVRSLSAAKNVVLWADDPKPDEKIENRHIYPILEKGALTAVVTTFSKVVVGGSFFDSLCSYAFLRIALLAYQYRFREPV